jgi:acyl-CoA hydrolase
MVSGGRVLQRAQALIALAHPDFREDLAREARAKNLIPRSFV